MRHGSFFGLAAALHLGDRTRRGVRWSSIARLLRVAGAVSLAAALVACSDEPGADGDGTAAPGATSSSGAGGGAEGGAGGAPSSSSAGPGGSGSGGGGAPTGGGAPSGGFPDHWIDGTDCGSEAEVMVWQYAEDTFILRQSLCTNFEGPFIYLLFGEDRALVQDSGTGDADLAGAVQGVVDAWLAAHGKTTIELVVTHSHGHGDHVGGDSDFAALPDATVVGLSAGAVQTFFGIDAWPTEVVEYDLGGRVLDVIPIPGHQSAHVALYDRARDLLFTGDTLYPGRLYIDNWNDYRQSVARLQGFVDGGNPVSWVLGTHIEMTTTPGDDYAFGADAHPSEHTLQLAPEVLAELAAAVEAMGGTPELEVHDDFIVYP
jgi:glyoxylase-like metal-dependent hydrolase (beta-lactamase superfamily II)